MTTLNLRRFLSLSRTASFLFPMKDTEGATFKAVPLIPLRLPFHECLSRGR